MLIGFHQVHIKAVHLKEKPYEWEFCQGRFSQKGNLQTHITSFHLKEKPHECDFCQERFSQKSSLQTHITVIHGPLHLKDKPHEREFCQEKFREGTSPRAHHCYPPEREASWVWVLPKYIFRERQSPKAQNCSPPERKASWVWIWKSIWQISHWWGFSLRWIAVMCLCRLPFSENLFWQNSH